MKSFLIFGVVILGLVAGLFMLSRSGDAGDQFSTVPNVSVVDGKQIVEIRARGGYEPRRSVAQAGIPTVIRFDAEGTYDCSAAVRIPSLKVSKNLPATGYTDIDIGTPKLGLLRGSCGMGMYAFEIDFQG